VEASTVNGGIQMDLDAITGDTKMVTVNGGVIVNVAPGLNADLEASVVNGGVRVQDGLTLAADERSRERVTGRIGNGGPRLVVQTTNGGVRVGLRGAPPS
jgi:putative adhesin